MDIKSLRGESLGKFIELKTKRTIFDELTGTDYYKGNQAILNKRRVGVSTKNGQQQYFVLAGLPNSIILDNQYAKLVDQKINYILSLAPTIKCGENDKYAQALTNFMDSRFLRTLGKVVKDAYNEGLGWLYLYQDADGLAYCKVNTKEITPIWRDSNHESLDAVIRERIETSWNDERMIEETTTYVEWYTNEGITTFIRKDGKLKELDYQPYAVAGETGYNWNKIPFVYFRVSDGEQSILSRIKSLQDGINMMLSNFSDRMLEDVRNAVMVLKGYDGADPVASKKNIMETGIIQVAGGSDGGDVDILNMDFSSENYEVLLRLLKEKLIENGRGIDAKNDKSGQTPNELNIKSMYSDIDLDANGSELEFQASFEYFQWFFRQVYGFGNEKADIHFRRNMVVNNEATITMIRDSKGLVSDETLLAKHPFVDNVDEEMKRIREEYGIEPDPMGGLDIKTLQKLIEARGEGDAAAEE